MEQLAAPVLSEIDVFVDKVLCDGRYCDEFSRDPIGTAHSVGVTLSPEAAGKVSDTPKEKLLFNLYTARFGNLHSQHQDEAFGAALLGPLVVIGVAILLIIVVIAVVKMQQDRKVAPKDHSPNAHLKL